MLITTSPVVKLYTLDEFWQLRDLPDHSKLELIRGVLYMTPPPNEYVHDPVTSQLDKLVGKELARLGDPGSLYFPRAGIWTYYPDTWLEPDLFYLSRETEERFRGKPRTSADLVIEVLSPESKYYDRTTKADTYAWLGVRELWLADPEPRSLEVRYGEDRQWVETRTFRHGERVLSRVLPDLILNVADVFAKLLPEKPL